MTFVHFGFWILDWKKTSNSLHFWLQSKSKIQNGDGGAERTRTVIVFVDSEVHKPFCHGPGRILDFGFWIGSRLRETTALDFLRIQNPKSKIQNGSGWTDRICTGNFRIHSAGL
jgi:hypothetical protein